MTILLRISISCFLLCSLFVFVQTQSQDDLSFYEGLSELHLNKSMLIATKFGFSVGTERVCGLI